ncbi:MAG: hypothetical protein LBJ90_00770 [Treponema sp.]|jgi:hypothetical protein|nr:hypothetical protein [Treponema sp.]
MKRVFVLFVIFLFTAPLFAQVRNSVNAVLEVWTKDGKDAGIDVGNVVIQRNGNEMQYTLHIRGGNPINFKYNRITKRLHRESKGEEFYSTAEASLGESGGSSVLTYTDKNGVVNMLKFRKR